ncbi:MAG: dynamin family protein [Leptolyngbya sp. UWPOB_LEPTO1]|uniref:dynamin family protein n=1 Tax=Leptolyngbya sp. UWPOB_LEPTO1 TaxID=2815653 RepID=UPI001AC5E48A|nr:dynamin family protein [Leptolyngbya sp. UWPOB_LEPTO1]MBN8564652.1 dynamin family protein [Leptolyngbya sp. UWPOB_LEPTO1]
MRIETTNFLDDLDRVAQNRAAMADEISAIAATLQQVETESAGASGQLGLEREIEDLTNAGEILKAGVFRLLVLGDMKRGKSTFLNALLGENLLPSDVNPCTALLTVLKYGTEKRVTIHFNDGKSPLQTDFRTFKEQYTIAPEEAKTLEQNNQQAFPDISHAVVEYPLALLEKGVEIVDSPGLNDTEARNELSLGYIHNCHAILFVMRSTQPCTLGERRYLENYIKDRGLSVFFLINAWDQVKESLIDPDDAEELAQAESKLRRVFRSNLAEYCNIDGYDLYNERLFEISAIQALRRRIKNPDANLDGTGFPEFLAALNTFLTQERAVSEMRKARTLARQAQHRVQESIDLRIPLLDQDLQELKQRIDSVEPEFQKLSEIRDRFRDEIRQLEDKKARAIADSFRTYLMGMEATFEQDFLKYQPNELQFFDFFSESKRERFNAKSQQGFQQYLNDKCAAWALTADQELKAAFSELSQRAEQHGASYSEVTAQISEKMTGIQARLHSSEKEESAPSWAKWAMGLFSLSRGNLAGAALAISGFDFGTVTLNLVATVGVAFLFGSILGPFGVLLAGLAIGAFQADDARQRFAKAVKKELVHYLPSVAQEQWQPIYHSVQECFEAYEDGIIQRIDDDIQSRKSELDNLVQQKESRQIDRDVEVDRLMKVRSQIDQHCDRVESIYRSLLG